MNSEPVSNKPFEAGVYDPSHRRTDTNSYWQWTSDRQGKEWDLAAECVNRGWPTTRDLSEPSAKWYGLIAGKENQFWIYRIYAAGRDRFGRDGRYFFVIIRMDSVEQVLSPGVAGLFTYFEIERGLPLGTDSLDNGWPDATPDEILKSVDGELRRGRTAGHWGIDDGLKITVFQDKSQARPRPISSNCGRSLSKEDPSRRCPSARRVFMQALLVGIRTRIYRFLLGHWKKRIKIGALILFLILIGIFVLLSLNWPESKTSNAPPLPKPAVPPEDFPPVPDHGESESL